MTRQMVMAAALAALGVGAGVARAQGTFTVAVPPPDATVARQGVFVGVAGGMPGAIAAPHVTSELVFVEPLEGGRPVTNAPYTAETVTESTQMLADGNRIVHRTSATVARDSQGRERREHEGVFFGGVAAQRRQALVTISDPSAGTTITLDAERKVASRLRLRDRLIATRSAVAGVRIAAPLVPPVPSLPALSALPALPAPAPLPAPGPGPEAMAWTFAPGAAGEQKSERLGTQTIEGVEAEGTRTTVTIPAGAIGNEGPIAIVAERWYSPELGVVMLSRRSDPRFGETVFRLVNVVRAEPPPDLFEIPPGYEVEEPPDVSVRPR